GERSRRKVSEPATASARPAANPARMAGTAARAPLPAWGEPPGDAARASSATRQPSAAPAAGDTASAARASRTRAERVMVREGRARPPWFDDRPPERRSLGGGARRCASGSSPRAPLSDSQLVQSRAVKPKEEPARMARGPSKTRAREGRREGGTV